MKNKRVKQMMVDVYKGEWINYNSNDQLYYGNGMKFHVFGGWLGQYKTTVELHKVVSLTASELKVKKPTGERK